MSILKERADKMEEILQGRFIRRALQDTARSIDKIQSKNMSGFKQDFWNNRSFTVNDGIMIHKHDKRQRFLDMRRRTNKDGSKNPKKSRVVHNKIIYGTYNYLVRELANGFTEAVKQELRTIDD